jgi:hypothetical protein
MTMAVTVGARAVGIESALGDPDDLRAAGAVELAPSVAAWVERHLMTRGAGTGPAGRARPSRPDRRPSNDVGRH